MKNYKRVQQKLSKAHHVERKGVCVTLVLTNYIRSVFFCQTDYLDWSDQRQHLSPEPDPLPGIPFDTRPDPIQFEKSSGSG